jgi:hypothetical protein
MSTPTKSAHRSTVTLSLPKKVPALIVYAENIVKRMTAVDDLRVAEAAALSRGKGAVATRNAKRTALVAILQSLRTYIQGIADADPANGPSLIESAGLAVRKTPTHRARGFLAKPGPVSGVAKVYAAITARRASYEWQYSTDGGKTWVSTPATLQAKTTVSGLTPGATVQFRYRPVTKTGEGDWSQPASIIVK